MGGSQANPVVHLGLSWFDVLAHCCVNLSKETLQVVSDLLDSADGVPEEAGDGFAGKDLLQRLKLLFSDVGMVVCMTKCTCRRVGLLVDLSLGVLLLNPLDPLRDLTDCGHEGLQAFFHSSAAVPLLRRLGIVARG